jgi:hypothetical protein
MTKPNDAALVGSSELVDLKKNAGEDWPDAIPVSGYLSEPVDKSDDDHENWRFRLFRTLRLREYIEFTWDDVVHIEGHSTRTTPEGSVTYPENPLEPVVVWLGVQADVTMSASYMVGQDEVNLVGDFVVGKISDLYLPHADLAARLIEGARGGAFIVGGSVAGCTGNAQCGG